MLLLLGVLTLDAKIPTHRSSGSGNDSSTLDVSFTDLNLTKVASEEDMADRGVFPHSGKAMWYRITVGSLELEASWMDAESRCTLST